jgi:hypothetical protein
VGIALANNEVEWFFRKGAGLPLKKKSLQIFRTIKEVKVGENGVAIHIPVVEEGG